MNPDELSSAKVILWCAPRSTSNLFTKCLTAIEGMEVWIEPYEYSHWALGEMKRLGLWDDTQQIPSFYEGNEEKFEKAADGMARFLGSKIVPQRLP